MRKAINLTMAGVLAMGLGITLSGCSDESSAKKESTVSTPGGTSTVTEQTKVKQTGDNPPPPKAP
jgi:hypothetical protein